MALYRRLGRDGRTVHWQVVIDVDDGTGRRRRQVLGTYPTKKQAEAAERTAKVERDQGALLARDRTTVSQLFDRWLADKAASVGSNTLTDYRIANETHIKPSRLGPVQIRRVGPADLQALYAEWGAAGKSARVIRGCHLLFAQAFSYAVRMQLIPHNPAKDARPPRLPARRVDFWARDESRRFLEIAQHNTLAPLWDILLREGCRRGEALALRWRDVDLEAGTALIARSVVIDKANGGKVMIQDRTKTRSGLRTIWLTEATIAAIRAHKDRRVWAQNEAQRPTPDGLIICRPDGRPVHPSNLVWHLDAMTAQAGLRKIRLHDLRHSAASLMLLAGVPAKLVSEKLGHSSVAITLNLYSHTVPSMHQDAARLMDELLG